MKPALLVIDVQEAFCQFGPHTAQSLDKAIEYINPVESISELVSYGPLIKALG